LFDAQFDALFEHWRNIKMKTSRVQLALVTSSMGIASLIITGCKTLAPVAAVDQSKNEVVFVTTSDPRTAAPELAQDRGVKDAKVALTERVKANSLDGGALIDLARLALVSGNVVDAESFAKRALRADTKNAEARKILAMVALKRNQLDLAEVFLNALGGFQSKDSSVLNLTGQLRLARGKNLLAAEAFRRALELNPNDIATRMNLGVLYLKHRQYNQAGVQFERVLAVMPKHDDARVHLAMVHAHRGKTKEALEALNTAYARNPSSELVLFNLASVERSAGQLENARKHLKQFQVLAKGKTEETEQVAAMLEDIQRQQVAEGNKVSDSDILKLAAKIKPSANGAKPETSELPPELTQEPKASEASKVSPAEPESNDVRDLERALQ
jgi:Flp pilus assembly protein TadD